jgi:PleD family two-component response regulator
MLKALSRALPVLAARGRFQPSSEPVDVAGRLFVPADVVHSVPEEAPMTEAIRPPAKVLLIHNGFPYKDHVKHLTDAGLRVTDASAETALTQVLRVQPDIVVLDFGCDGEVTAQLKGDSRTSHIPVIALVELTAQR